MAKLYFRYGAMGSSKTANAIMVQYNYHERGQNALMLKPRLDDRDGARIVGSRSGLSAPCSYVEELDSLDLSAYDCVIVDESQFLTKAQVQKLVDIVDRKNIPVICYGLRADFRGELFEGSTWLMAWADTIEEIKTVCWCGRKATYNARIFNGKVVKDGAQVMLGGNESYVALCRRHWANGELAPVEVRKISTGRKLYDPLVMENAKPLSDETEMYVLIVNGSAVSAICIHAEDDKNSRIVSLMTDPAHRRKGHATQLLKHITKLYGPRCETLAADTCDETAAACFEHAGFVRTGSSDSIHLVRTTGNL